MSENHHNNLYPKLTIKNNTHPSKLLAFPLIGTLIRFILVIPVAIAGVVYSLWYFLLWLYVPFVIIFTGKYPDYVYNFFLSYFKFYIKVSLYLMGLTDKYPGFGLNDAGLFELHFEKPKHPSRLLGSPIVGTIIRILFIIPYAIYESVLMYGSRWAVVFSWFTILFKGKYHESLYEFNRDYLRVATAETMYISYLTDTYPSFQISMNHKKIKILLIVLGTFGVLNSFISSTTDNPENYDNFNNYQDSPLYLPES